jgi:hypothetical protein
LEGVLLALSSHIRVLDATASFFSAAASNPPRSPILSLYYLDHMQDVAATLLIEKI